MKAAYPIVLKKGKEFIIVYIPDFDINTQGRDLAEAIESYGGMHEAGASRVRKPLWCAHQRAALSVSPCKLEPIYGIARGHGNECALRQALSCESRPWLWCDRAPR